MIIDDFIEVGAVQEIWRYPERGVHPAQPSHQPLRQVINVDPDTAVLQLITQTRNNHGGVGGTPDAPGLIRVGDVIKLAADFADFTG